MATRGRALAALSVASEAILAGYVAKVSTATVLDDDSPRCLARLADEFTTPQPVPP